MKRTEMMYDCPEEFKEILSEIIDDIEDKVLNIKDLLDVTGLDDLAYITDAYAEVEQLLKDLY